MENQTIENLTKEEKSRIVTEELFGLKVIHPQDYFANLKGGNADYWRQQAGEFTTNDPVVVKGNKPYKTHKLDSYPAPDFYGAQAYELLARARVALFARNLHVRFAEALALRLAGDPLENLYWALVNASAEDQVEAIVEILMQERQSAKKNKSKTKSGGKRK